MLQSTFNPGLTLTGFRTTRPRSINNGYWQTEYDKMMRVTCNRPASQAREKQLILQFSDSCMHQHPHRIYSTDPVGQFGASANSYYCCSWYWFTNTTQLCISPVPSCALHNGTLHLVICLDHKCVLKVLTLNRHPINFSVDSWSRVNVNQGYRLRVSINTTVDAFTT